MSFSNVYRLSVYTMLVAASLVLSVDANDVSYAMAFPVVVAVAGAIAFVTVDRKPATKPTSHLQLNLLALATFPAAAAEYMLNETNVLLLALGHWLIYLELILIFRPKPVNVDWELFVLGVVQVLVGTVISQSDSVGLILFSWAVLALWVLGLFSLERDALRARGDGRNAGIAGASAGHNQAEPYPGLLNASFLLSTARVTATTMALGGVIFLALPRQPGMTRAQGGDSNAHHLTGFDDEVRLGQLGEILENDSVVMSIEMFNDRGESVAPEGEPLWRGVTMARYENGRWYRQGRRSVFFTRDAPNDRSARDPNRPQGEIRQVIKLEPNDSNVLFGLRPMLDAKAPRRFGLDLNGVDGTISKTEPRPGSYDYEVRSSRDPDLPQPGEIPPDASLRNRYLINVPERARDRIKAIAERVIESTLPPDRRDDTVSRAQALMLYLRQSGEFSYTLKLEVTDPTLDPVEDFLINRKSGHCEYFASALAMLLRSVEIPARLVNGFKGGDYNDLARVVYVRQKHAHSWVEVYLGEDSSPDHLPLWLTLDPTPANARDESVALVGGFRRYFRQVTDFIRYVWVFYIVGYNADRQNRLVYQPIRELVAVARRGFEMMGEGLSKGYAGLLQLLHFETTRSFFSPRGFVVSFVILLLIVVVYWLSARLFKRISRWLGGVGEESTSQSVGAAHYRRLAVLLSGCGLERPPAETPDEFARRATVLLTARGSNTEAVADVPGLVVDAFYRVRFGHVDPSDEALARLDARLDALEANLKATPA